MNQCGMTVGGRRIRRAAYTTRRGVHVKARLIKDVGAPGKWKSVHGDEGIGPMRKGELASVGYSVTRGKTARHRALRKASRKFGPLSTFRKLNAVATYTKRTSKGKSHTFRSDRDWVKKIFMKK
jgi:hypothetical protein